MGLVYFSIGLAQIVYFFSEFGLRVTFRNTLQNRKPQMHLHLFLPYIYIHSYNVLYYYIDL